MPEKWSYILQHVAGIIEYNKSVVFTDRKINVSFYSKKSFDDSEIGSIVNCHELTTIKGVISTL